MTPQKTFIEVIADGEGIFQPSLSLDCVIFGFHENELKVLLIKLRTNDNWALDRKSVV